MKSITIHGLNDPLDELIRIRAQQEGLSLNKTIKKLLAHALGLEDDGQLAKQHEFADLCGKWQDSDVIEFNKNVETLNKINAEDWQ